MSKEPSVPPYFFQSPPANGATYQHRPDHRADVPRQPSAGSNGNGHGAEREDSLRTELDVDAMPVQQKGSMLDQFWARFRPVSLAKDEKESGDGSADDSVAGVVHSINLKGAFESPVAEGGEIRLLMPWQIDTGKLKALTFSYDL